MATSVVDWGKNMLERIGLTTRVVDEGGELGEDISNAEPDRENYAAAPARPQTRTRREAPPVYESAAPDLQDAPQSQYTSRRGNDNMVNINSMRPAGFQSPDTKQQTVIYYLRAFEDCKEVIDDLLDQKTILLNLEDMDDVVNQRAIDMLSGAAYALNATLKKAAKATYLIAPNSVSVTDSSDNRQTRYGAPNLRSIK